MVKFALIRHGPTEWNEQKRLQGQTDMPLSPNGRAIVSRWCIPEEISDWRWYASTMSRAQQTAELLGITPLPAPEIVEMNWGEWEGKTREEIDAEFGREFRERSLQGIDLRPKNGETPRELRNRANHWINCIAKLKKPFGAVAHQGIIRAALSLCTGWEMVGKPPVELEWASVHIFSVNKEGEFRIERLNVSLVSQVGDYKC